MNKTDLVVLKGGFNSILQGVETLYPNKFYRHCDMGDGNHLVYGCLFTSNEFNLYFEYAHDRVMRDFKTIELLKANNQPINKTSFKRLVDIHGYGYGRNTKHIWFFRSSRNCIYGFYPEHGLNKREQLNECYRMYNELVNGFVDCLDDGGVKFGNCGIPLIYDELRVI